MSENVNETIQIKTEKKAYINVEKKTAILNITCKLMYGRFDFINENQIEFNLINESVEKSKDWIIEVENNLKEEVLREYNQVKENLKIIEELGYSLVFQ